MITTDATNDPRGIPGWERVAKLATKLLDVTGIAPTTKQAEQIKNLYNALHTFDKKAIEVRLKLQTHLRGRFCSKKHSGHTTIQQMRRYASCTSLFISVIT